MTTNPTDSWILGSEESGKTKGNSNINIQLTKPRVKLKDVAWAMDKLATTQDAGIASYRALGMLSDMRKNDAIGMRMGEMRDMMAEGSTLGQAVRVHEKDFGSLVAALVEAGEASGNLERALSRAAAFTDARVRLQRKIRGALIYPVSVVTITIALIAALLIFVVPQFEEIYASVGSDLPTMTQILVTLSNYAPLIAGILGVLVLAGYLVNKQSRKDENLRRKVDGLKLMIPITGKLVRQGINARIASTLSSLLGAGIPLLSALEYSAQTANNILYSDELLLVRQKVNDGLRLSQALAQSPQGMFPELFIQMVSIGEDTGAISDLMDKYAKDSEEEVADTAEALTRIIEPLMMVVIGGVVGVFLLGLYLPIIQIGNQIQ